MRVFEPKHGNSLYSRAILRVIACACALLCVLSLANSASAQTRTLKLYYINTGERAEITFKRNGRYSAAGLKKLNRFLRDWRRKEATKMDPKLFDLVWEIHRETGSKNSIHVVSAYRSPATNAMLRRTRGGQAKKSQHMVGRAMDFYIPGVKSSTLRKIGLRKGAGGVGYYPRSNSPYVHMDTGRVRHWPRMTRRQLVAVFPKGRTLHVPSDGKPLKGYKLAQADYRRLKAGKSPTSRSGQSGGGLLAALGFGNGPDDDEDKSNVPTPKRVKTAAVPKVAPAAAQPAGPAVTPEDAIIPIVLPNLVATPRGNPRRPAIVAPKTEPEILVAAVEPTPAPPLAAAQVPLPDSAGAIAAAPQTAIETNLQPKARPQTLDAQAERLAAGLPAENETILASNEANPSASPETETPELESPVLTALAITPRNRPEFELPTAVEPEATPEETILLATLPQPNPSPDLAPTAADKTAAKTLTNPNSKTTSSPDFTSRLLLAHQAVDETPETAAIIAALRNVKPAQKPVEPQPILVAKLEEPKLPEPQQDAVPMVQIAALPSPAPRPAEAVEIVTTAIAPVEDNRVEVASIRPTPENAVEIAEPQFDLASAAEFTRDGDMAIGKLNGATVLGWALTPQDPIRVKKRGLRAPAYGQNALRLAPVKLIQSGFAPLNATPRWTSLQQQPQTAETKLTLASLN